ncbi:MAG: sulfatase-like hydrolase/transferase [Acidobacteriaceae bacterium]
MAPLIYPVETAAGERHAGFAVKARQAMNDSLTPLAYLILPNLPLLLLRHKLTLVPHGVINLECLLLGILSLFIPRSLVFVLLVAEITGAFIYEICYSFQFRLADLITASQSLPDLPRARVIEFVVTVLLVLAVAALVAFGVPRPKHRMRTSLILLAMTVLVAGVDFADGTNPMSHADVMTASHRLSIAPWLTLGVRGEFFGFVDNMSHVRNTSPMDSASAMMMGGFQQISQGPGGARPNVVELVVESWGLFNDSPMAKALVAPYDSPQLRADYDVSFGTAPFDGLTVPGEARELCHAHLGFGILHVKAARARSCLPEEFAAMGYQTVAIHGYTGNVFQRDRWYRQLGFERTWFQPDLAAQGLPECPGVFPGICDTAIVHWIGKRFLAGGSQKPQFVYYMTLNSHIPLPLTPGLPPDNLCSSAAVLQSSEALCSWFRIIHAVHASVAQLALQEVSRPTIFVLVGDHAPPFATPSLREQFSQTVVPYVILMPRALRHSATPGSGAGPARVVAATRGAVRNRTARQETGESSSGN